MKKHQRLWSKKILGVLETYTSNQNLLLFGITGDLDNLGIFVSRYGRPPAENLVDVYNHLIGAFMYKYVKRQSRSIQSFCMIPSGEEIFAIGVANNKSAVNVFFSLMQAEVNNFIRENTPFENEDVTASFGCKIFSGNTIDTATSNLVRLVKKRRVQEASLAYLDLMLVMRRELAYELDRAKFESLNASALDLVVLFRNVVYTKLQNYKEETKEALTELASQLSHDPGLQKRLRSLMLNSAYGVAENDARFIKDLIKYPGE